MPACLWQHAAIGSVPRRSERFFLAALALASLVTALGARPAEAGISVWTSHGP